MSDMLDSEMYARYETEFLIQLCAIWPDPKTGKPGISQYALSNGADMNKQAVSNYFNGRYPDSKSLRKLGKFFKIVHFVEDWNGHINNDQVLESIKQHLEATVYGESID